MNLKHPRTFLILFALLQAMPSLKSFAAEGQKSNEQRVRDYVAAREKASWQGKSGSKSQASLSVYEFRAGLIARVYYYPAEK